MSPSDNGAGWDPSHLENRQLQLAAMQRGLRHELVRLEDAEAIFSAACRFAVGVGGFRMAWVGVVSPERDAVKPVASEGSGIEYLGALSIALDDSPRGRGPTATAVKTGEPRVVQDIAADPSMDPWRERAMAFGFRASAAFPFLRGGEVAGALNVYADETGFGDAVVTALLEGVADDIGLALDAIDQRAARQQAEKALAESEQRFRAIFERASDAIFVANGEQRYIDANPAALALVGYTKDELCQLHLCDLVPPEDLVSQPIALGRFAANQGFVVERRLLRKDGSIVEVELSGVKLPDGAAQSIVRDISERKRLLAERAASERVASLGRLAQGVGHEINNPLAYLVLSLDLLKSQLEEVPIPLRAELLESVGHVDEAAARIATIVRSLSHFGRGDGETVGPVVIERVTRAAVAMTANRLNHVATAEVALGPSPNVLANEFQLTQVFVNLLLNAADAMADAGGGPHRVRITSSLVDTADGPRVAVDVSDTGPGVPPQLRESVFAPYVTTKPVGRGTGLGLSICRSIVTSFAGEITLVDTEVGATFRLLLVPTEQRPAIAVEAPAPTLERMRILVVDDEPLILKTLQSLLRDHQVTIATSPSEALTLCRERAFDKVLCDLMFPGDSTEVFFDSLVREQPRLSAQLVFMTGGAFTAASHALLEKSGRPWLGKPFSAQELMRVLAG